MVAMGQGFGSLAAPDARARALGARGRAPAWRPSGPPLDGRQRRRRAGRGGQPEALEAEVHGPHRRRRGARMALGRATVAIPAPEASAYADHRLLVV